MFKATKKIDTGVPHKQTFFPTLKRGGGGGVNDLECLLFYYLLKIINEILLISLKNDCYLLCYNK